MVVESVVLLFPVRTGLGKSKKKPPPPRNYATGINRIILNLLHVAWGKQSVVGV